MRDAAGAATTGERPLIELADIQKVYASGDVRVHALRGVTLGIARGEFVAVMGSSGSGKSTLMNILGCLDRPTSGIYKLDGAEVSRLSKAALAEVRNKTLGFVFQNFDLLARTSAQENVELPLVYARVSGKDRRRRRHRRAHARGSPGTHGSYTQSAVGRSAAARRDRARDRLGAEGDPRG